jgi:hypothetical protein
LIKPGIKIPTTIDKIKSSSVFTINFLKRLSSIWVVVFYSSQRKRLGVCWGISIPSAHNRSPMIAILLMFYS